MPQSANPQFRALRQRIRALEQGRLCGRVTPFGLPAVDAALPGGGLALGALHEIMGAGADEEDGAVAAGFAAALLAAAVLGEIGSLAPTAGRRLQLACEAGGVTAFVLRRWREAGMAARQRAAPSAAVTRWRVAAAPSRDIAEPGVGTPLWRVELVRCRGGAPGAWLIAEGLKEEVDATDHVALAAGLADRPAAPRLARAG